MDEYRREPNVFRAKIWPDFFGEKTSTLFRAFHNQSVDFYFWSRIYISNVTQKQWRVVVKEQLAGTCLSSKILVGIKRIILRPSSHGTR